MSNLSKSSQSLSELFYALLLAAYPQEFRREYGREMLQVFRDCCRAETERSGRLGAMRVWARTALDLARTAPVERLHTLSGRLNVMKALRTIALAIVVYIAAVMIVGKLLVAGRAYLPYAAGAMLDSLLSIGIAFNFIALILVTTKIARPVKAVVAASVCVVLLLSAVLLLLPAEARPGATAMTTMVLSLLFWFGAHRWWAHRREQSAAES
ncbi:MAG TPA: hypothetical protein VJS44_10300 [Pyrinomonadaceae bacterium]|nr:hypothetical protein [Pyrinomonadaceae bacterium]